MANYSSFYTRKELEAMSLTQEQISAISERHGNSMSAMRDDYEEQIKNLKGQLDTASKERDELTEKLTKEQKDFADYKAGKDAETVKTKKVEAYKALLKDAKISESIHDDILSLVKFDDIELDKEGNIKGSDKVKASLENKWSKFIEVEQKKGADPQPNPGNGNSGSTTTKDDILKIEDAAKRQQAIAEHPELFGLAPQE